MRGGEAMMKRLLSPLFALLALLAGLMILDWSAVVQVLRAVGVVR